LAHAPKGGRDDPGNDIQRPGPVDVLPFRINREGNAHLQDRPLQIRLALTQLLLAETGKVAHERAGSLPRLAGDPDQFVVERSRVVVFPVDFH
jgi:hypothetical protein